MALESQLLGRFAVRRDGTEIPARDFGGRLVRMLVRILVSRRGQTVTRDALIDALWGDYPPADPAANLNVLVNRARRVLGDPCPVETVAGGYAFAAGPSCLVDAEVFLEPVTAARGSYHRAGSAAVPRTAVSPEPPQ